jgi:tRNA(Ile)-lysidine synthase
MSKIISDAALLSAFHSLGAFPSAALAVSGGPDSVALMHLAMRWHALSSSMAGLTILTVDHGLRPESGDEAAFVCEEAAKLGLRHETLPWRGAKPKTGVQAAARRARYALMADYCRANGIACAVTAHTRDDQAETFLMRLRRGSGVDGLAAMAPVSRFHGLPLVRPLLLLSKPRLLAYLRDRGLPFVEDPSNENPAFERVRVRQAMRAFAAAGITNAALARTAGRLARARSALIAGASAFMERAFAVRNLGQGEIEADPFFSLPDEIAMRVLGQALSLVGGRAEPPRMAKVERLLLDLQRGKCDGALGGCLIFRDGNQIRIYREVGRMRGAALEAFAGTECIFDGRFIVSLPASIPPGLTLAPLGAKGWSVVRKAAETNSLILPADRRAAESAPALWKDDQILAAPCLGFVNFDRPLQHDEIVKARLVAPLRQFLKSE